ncbi:thioredoxin-like domain-containing protein [Leptospira alstonii]|uniref:Thioredoxin-like domain protein n=2 Tax=Leptospira alstonii TaxID=28452 RepID=M6CRT7_9LEPT|nr:thioredoxin-like domain-containing protein [Leptospira alstonii]EMJ94409.1 thioredoxin-like domain protein [Leptospira alstonii serovar Sichuan str. 79601]EQA82556.1 thioredoxin-like domain protein [Leptospira alstonii serovar Pingchang str. 80-412]
MKEILKKSGKIALWVFLFLAVTISLSIFKASDIKPGISLDTLRGSAIRGCFDCKPKVTVVYFWATWCGVCSTNLPLVKWYSHQLENSSRFSFVSVEEGESEEQLNRYVREKDLQFKIIRANVSFLKEWKVNSYPSFVILDRSGRIRFADSGMMNPFSFFLRIWIAYFL